jgi:outer membrane lipoprotein-sorting protein
LRRILGSAACVGLVLLLVAAAARAQTGAKAKTEAAPPTEVDSWHAERFARSERGMEMTYLWSKGRKLRVEMVVSGIPVVTIVNGPRYYAIDSLHGVGVAIERSARAVARDARGGRPFGTEVERILADGGEKVGTEELAGQTLDLYRVTDGTGRRQAWATQKEPKLPIRVEIFDRPSGQTTRADYLEWTRRLDVPDSFFEPDPRIRLESVTYDDYVKRSATEAVGPVPVLFGDLLHGERR